MTRARWLGVVLLTSSVFQGAQQATASTRVAVMAHDPLGRGDLLARRVAERLRARGMNAVAVAAPTVPAPAGEDDAARRAGASRLVVLELRTRSDRKLHSAPNTDVLRPGTPEKPYNPNVPVGPILFGPTMAPAGVPNGAWGSTSDVQELYVFVPQLPYAAVEPSTQQRIAVQTETHLVARSLGAAKPDVEQTLAFGAMIGWRADLAPPGSDVREQKSESLWNALLGQIADHTARVVARR